MKMKVRPRRAKVEKRELCTHQDLPVHAELLLLGLKLSPPSSLLLVLPSENLVPSSLLLSLSRDIGRSEELGDVLVEEEDPGFASVGDELRSEGGGGSVEFSEEMFLTSSDDDLGVMEGRGEREII